MDSDATPKATPAAHADAHADVNDDVNPGMDLGRQLMDRMLLDRNGRLAGKVDDVLLEAPMDASGAVSGEPEVVAIVTGPLALAGQWGRWVTLARLGYWLLGVRDPHPIEIPWSRVERLGVDVHLTLARDDVPGMDEPGRSASRRYIERIPGN